MLVAPVINVRLGEINNAMFYVYILENQATKSWYIGFSGNLKQRLKQHQHHEVRTTCYWDWELIYYEAYRSKRDAMGREEFLKSGSGRRFLKKQLRHYLSEVM